ncbi:MAG: hypothetical protein ACM3NH_02280 [Candidatus Saccharibacteria bacterium]
MLKPSKTWTSNNPGTRLGILAIAGALIVIGVVWFAIVRLNAFLNPTPQFYSDVKNVDIKTYSLSGQVKTAAPEGIVFTAGQVITGKKGNELKFYDKTALVTSETKVFRRISKDSPDFEAANASDISAGKDITVYTAKNPYENDRFEVDRIEIN